MEPILRDVNGNSSNERNSPIPTTTTIPPTPITSEFHRRHSAPRHHGIQRHYDVYDNQDYRPNTVNNNNNIDSGEYAAGGSGGGGNSGKASVVRNIPIQVLGNGTATVRSRCITCVYSVNFISGNLCKCNVIFKMTLYHTGIFK